MKKIGLKSFLVGTTDPKLNIPGCTNYDQHYGGCLFLDNCLVSTGQRCSYFEKYVLPVAGQIGLAAHIVDLYSKTTKSLIILKDKTRYCDCGEVLLPKKRFCEKCIRQNRREQYRSEKKKQRG